MKAKTQEVRKNKGNSQEITKKRSDNNALGM
jgi:hypothetical protein